MRLSHKRKVQFKLQKQIKAKLANTAVVSVNTKPAAAIEKAAEQIAAIKPLNVALTPKQKQVLDIVLTQPEGINSKGIGLQAGQEESKAASWATGALKKLLDENLVEKVQLGGNKVIYKAI